MEKFKAIPEGYMTVGEIAREMGVTVRTLQYYDKEGLLTPSSESEGGRRLYNYKDVIKLHQILSLKHLGFSLGEIKNRLTVLDTPAKVADALTEQAAAVRKKIESLSECLKEIEMLQAEVLQIQEVDFKKYADIIVNLQMKNEYYWLIKHFDDTTLEYFRSHFDMESSHEMMLKITRLQEEAIQHQKNGVPPESEKGQNFAKEFWNLLMEFTGGDISMLSKLMELDNIDGPESNWKQKQTIANAFIEPALGVYFANLGYDPLEVGENELCHTN